MRERIKIGVKEIELLPKSRTCAKGPLLALLLVLLLAWVLLLLVLAPPPQNKSITFSQCLLFNSAETTRTIHLFVLRAAAAAAAASRWTDFERCTVLAAERNQLNCNAANGQVRGEGLVRYTYHSLF